MTENFYRNGNRQAFDSFREQYGSNNFNILKENLANNLSALLLFQNCNLILLPQAEQLIDCCMKDDYINITTYCQNFSPSELEKKNDYLHFSSLILLNEWTESYLPKYLRINSSDPKTRIMQDSIWIRIIDVCKRLGEIYDELEKNYK